MRVFLTSLTVLSALGAKYPDGMLDLNEAQRWQGVAIMAGITLLYFIIRPHIIKHLNNA